MTTHTRNMMASDLADVAVWCKSSHSNGGGNCVEAADLTHTPYSGVAVRDSKDPDGPALLFTPEAFAAFVADARTGRYGG